MGASNIEFRVAKGTDLHQWYRDAVREAIDEHGRDRYNGTISTTAGLTITTLSFYSFEEAVDWLNENTEKWGVVKAVTVEEEKTGKKYWVVGGWAAS